MRRSRVAAVAALALSIGMAGAGSAVAASAHHGGGHGVAADASRVLPSHPAAGHHARHAAASSASSRRAALAKMRANPARDVAAKPDYGICWSAKNSQACITRELAAINRARAREGVRPMVLPHNFRKLSSARQTYIVTNFERTARGLRPFAELVQPLDSRAYSAARSQEDPYLSSWQVGSAQAWKYASNQATDLNALAADYDYMYNDGYAKGGSVNADCTSPHASGCWVHRENILAHYPRLPLLIAGVAEVNTGQLESSAMIMVGAKGHAPHAVLTWKSVQRTLH